MTERSLEEFLATLRPGETCTGTVTKTTPIGVFVRVGAGVEGLVRQDGDERRGEPVETGAEVEVMIVDVDREGRRLLLLQARPGARPIDTDAVRP